MRPLKISEVPGPAVLLSFAVEVNVQVEVSAVLTVMLKGASWRTHSGASMCDMRGAKRAVTVWLRSIVTRHVPVPGHSLGMLVTLQLSKTCPSPGVAVRVTLSPRLNSALHVGPQFITFSGIELCTVPKPILFTVSKRRTEIVTLGVVVAGGVPCETVMRAVLVPAVA